MEDSIQIFEKMFDLVYANRILPLFFDPASPYDELELEEFKGVVLGQGVIKKNCIWLFYPSKLRKVYKKLFEKPWLQTSTQLHTHIQQRNSSPFELAYPKE